MCTCIYECMTHIDCHLMSSPSKYVQLMCLTVTYLLVYASKVITIGCSHADTCEVGSHIAIINVSSHPNRLASHVMPRTLDPPALLRSSSLATAAIYGCTMMWFCALGIILTPTCLATCVEPFSRRRASRKCSSNGNALVGPFGALTISTSCIDCLLICM